MTETYQLTTRTEHGWQFATITSDQGIRFELSYRLPEVPWGLDSPVHYSITTNNPNGKGVHLDGEAALSGWWALRELDEIQNGLTQFVIGWHQRAQAALKGAGENNAR